MVGTAEGVGGSAPEKARGGLLSVSFVALVVTQFLVSMNDNMFRWLVVPFGKHAWNPDLGLALGSGCMVLPFVLWAGPAGGLADRFSKRRVMIACKVAEIVFVLLGIMAIASNQVPMMFAVLFILASQAAIFSPCKLGSIPEIVRADRISAANGVMGMSTVLAIITGTVAGNQLYDWCKPEAEGGVRWQIPAVALLSVALVGWFMSLWIGPLRAANPTKPIPWNPVAQSWRNLRGLAANRALLLAAIGSAYYWSLGVLVTNNTDKLAVPDVCGSQENLGPLLAVLAVGVGVGSVLAGILSRGKVELGMVPLGTAGMAVGTIMLTTVPAGVGIPASWAYVMTGVWLGVLGISAGLHDIPLQAFMQEQSPEQSRGSTLAAYNFISFGGMLLASGVFWVLGSTGMSARGIFLTAGIATVGVFLVVSWLLAGHFVRLFKDTAGWFGNRFRA